MFSLTVFGCALFRAALQHEKEIHHLERKNKKLNQHFASFVIDCIENPKVGSVSGVAPVLPLPDSPPECTLMANVDHTHTRARAPLFPHAAASFAFPSERRTRRRSVQHQSCFH